MTPVESRDGSTSTTVSTPPSVQREKVRIRFRKEGTLRFVSHNDLMRCWERLLRRTRLPIKRTQGYHPKMRLSSPLALALGVAGHDEILEFELDEPTPIETIERQIEAEAVEGLTIVRVSRHRASERTEVTAVEYTCSLPPGHSAAVLAAKAAQLLATETLPVTRRTPGKPDRPFDLRPFLLAIDVADDLIRFRVAVRQGATARVEELLAAMGLGSLATANLLVARTKVELADA